MNEFKQKLMSAGLCAAVLLGACAPLTAMAAQTSPPPAQASTADASQAGDGIAVQGLASAVQDAQAAAPAGTAPAAGPAQQEVNQTGEHDDGDDAAQQAQLAAQAKITEAEAIAAAQAAYPGSTVTAKGLDGENGSVFYELKVQPADGSKAVRVSVDAISGTLSTHTEENEDENDVAQQAQLAAQAKITEAEAIAAAQAAYPGSTVTVKELDGEDGKVIYDLKVQPTDGSKAFEAAVDAVTGDLLPAESDD